MECAKYENVHKMEWNGHNMEWAEKGRCKMWNTHNIDCSKYGMWKLWNVQNMCRKWNTLKLRILTLLV